VPSSDGQKCHFIFLKDKERLDSMTYISYLREKVFPWARDTYGESLWLQHDGASCHTSRVTQDELKQKNLQASSQRFLASPLAQHCANGLHHLWALEEHAQWHQIHHQGATQDSPGCRLSLLGPELHCEQLQEFQGQAGTNYYNEWQLD
jgi:hypothetical protein